MNEPARKRRRTTPPDEREPTSSPLKQPPRRPEQRGRTSSPLKRPPRRPSFASPTKASLARFNPNLLQRSSSSSRPDSRGDVLARGNQALQYIYTDAGDLGHEGQQSIQETDGEAPASAGAEEQNPFQPQQRMRRTPPAQHELEDVEPELPSSSSLRAMAQQDTPRRGVLFSSPSKRPPRVNESFQQSFVRPITKLLRAAKPAGAVDVSSTVEEGKEHAASEKQPVQPPNPELERRKQEKARLLHEMKQLDNEITQCTAEIHKRQRRSHAEVLNLSQRNTLISLIKRTSGSNLSRREEQVPTVSSLMCSFLPFSAHTVPPSDSRHMSQKPVSSHRPLQQEDPLLCLKLFTSVDFTSQVKLVDSGDFIPSSSVSYQKHTIDITDTHKLLAASIVATIDSATKDVIGLSIKIPSWAERDLGDFTRLRAQENDLSAACWGIGSYWEASKKRAEFWRRCESTFAHLIPGRASEDMENIDQPASGKFTQHLSRKDLRRHLGRDVLVLEDKYVLLRINWRMIFDWTGEAESEISISPALPAVWTEVDSNGSLAKIPETFNSLLQKNGAFEATKTMVALLFSG